MESVAVELAFKIAISNINKLPKSNILFIDENISVFDKQRIDNIGKFFNFVLSHFSFVFLITHLDVTDKINYHINIQKYNNRSYINNTNTNIKLDYCMKSNDELLDCDNEILEINNLTDHNNILSDDNIDQQIVKKYTNLRLKYKKYGKISNIV